MISQPELFALGEDLRDQGIAQVTEHNPDWIESAIETIRAIAQEQGSVTADDLRELEEPPHPNCVGAAFREAANRGYIKRAGYQRSHAPSAHARVITVWERV